MRQNQLTKINHKISKEILFAAAMLLDLLLAIISYKAVKEYIMNNIIFKHHAIQYSIFILFWIFINIFLYRKIISKKSRKSYSIMKKFCSYKELYDLVNDENFLEISCFSIDKILESKLWLIIGDTFIPKNYIVCGRFNEGNRGIYILTLVLIDGSSFCASLTSDKEQIEKVKIILQKAIDHFVIIESDKNIKNIRIKLADKYKDEISKGNSYKKLIESWNKEFENINE